MTVDVLDPTQIPAALVPVFADLERRAVEAKRVGSAPYVVHLRETVAGLQGRLAAVRTYCRDTSPNTSTERVLADIAALVGPSPTA